MTGRIVLVCGGRDYGDVEHVCDVLDRGHAAEPIGLLIQGGAMGVDNIARAWASSRGVHCAEVAALWDRYGKAAGHLRNAAMLRLRPDVVVAFPGGRGTADMVAQARAAGVRVVEVPPPTEAS